jgi:type I restriction enzyme S subunit
MVEWKKLGEVCSNVFAGGTPSTKREDYYDGDIPWIRSGEIDFNVITKAERNITKEGFTNSSAKMIRKGSVVMAMTGATVAKSAVVEIETTANQSVCALETNEAIVNYKYLYYSLAEDYFGIKSSAQGALTSLNLAMIKQIEIPIPSLSEQERIVGILDTFTASIDNLKEQIAQRRKQYEYYRDELLDLEGKEGVEMKTLGEVCVIGDGLHGTPIYNETGDYFFINGNNLGNGKILIKSDTKKVDDTMFSKYGIELDNKTILMSINGTIGNIAVYNGEKIILGKSAAYFKIFKDDVILYRFLYYLLQTTNSNNYYMESLTGTTIKNLGLKALRNYVFPLPPLQEQQRIVSILDTFEASIQNLEAQLKQREKQYEYYRNKLLTFE